MSDQVEILTVLACASIFQVWSASSFFVVVGIGKHELFGWITLAKAAVASVTALAGLSYADWGTREVALAFSLPEVATTALILLPYCCRQVGVGVAKLLRLGVWPALLASAPFLVFAFGARSVLRSASLGEFAIGVVLLGLVALAGIWLLGLTPGEKRALRSAVRG
jgi:hypothetical protein